MKIGAHVSVAGGLHKAIEKGIVIGAEVLQIFVSGPQSYQVTDYSDEQIVEFKKMYQSAGFSGLFLHAIYLINLASPNPRLVDFSKASLIHYMNMGNRLGAEGVIVHLGSWAKTQVNNNLLQTELASFDKLKTSHSSLGPAKQEFARHSFARTSSLRANYVAYKSLGREIKYILVNTPKSQKFIIENCACPAVALAKEGGPSGKIGKDLDELELLYKEINDECVYPNNPLLQL